MFRTLTVTAVFLCSENYGIDSTFLKFKTKQGWEGQGKEMHTFHNAHSVALSHHGFDAQFISQRSEIVQTGKTYTKRTSKQSEIAVNNLRYTKKLIRLLFY